MLKKQDIKELLLRDDKYLSIKLKKELKTGRLINYTVKNIILPGESLITLIHRNDKLTTN